MKLVVIGGVAAGASAAARARRLDEQAEIVVLERGEHVSFANCGLPYHIGGSIPQRESLLLQTPQSLKAQLALDVRTGHEALAIDRAGKRVRVRELATGREYAEPYDKLVLCPGAEPIRPDLPGADLPHVFVLRDLCHMDRIKAAVDGGARAAVVVGAGYIGVELAENLCERGLDVSLVELTDQILPPLDPEMVRSLERELRHHGVTLHLGTAAAAFRDDAGRVAVELRNGRTVRADFVVLAVGVRPDTALARAAGLELGPRGAIRVDAHLRTSDPDIYAAGDAVEVPHTVLGGSWFIPLAGPANRQGRTAADNLCGRDTVYASSQGTSIVKVFDWAAGGTGATEKNLVKAGRPFRKVYMHPADHASYYPGATPLHLKVLFDPENGKLLGAQVVGRAGVDKRLDVLSTAIHAGMTVFDLESLELAYAPPFGAAKDPVNMAGFVGSNLLRGDAAFWYAEDFPACVADGVLVDVCSPAEYDLRHLPGAINIPLNTLRARLGELRPDQPVYLYCKVGFRSYLAQRLLRQRGFPKATTLAGGLNTFDAFHPPIEEAKKAAAQEAPFEHYVEPPKPAALRTVDLDCTAMQCPGPILKLRETMDTLEPGDEIHVRAADPGFLADAPAWCRQAGHTLLDVRQVGAVVEAKIRKAGAPRAASAAEPATATRPKTMVVFSGDLDRAMAAFIIANGAASAGAPVTMFFTFWGLNILRRAGGPRPGKGLLEKMFGWMMPRGAGALKLSKLNMMGVGTALMKHVMRTKRVESLPSLMASAQKAGVNLIACTMTMDIMGIRQEELIEGVSLGGVATFLGEADRSGTTLFI